MSTTNEKALQCFVRDTLREARRQQAFGDRGMAAALRAGASDAIAEYRAAHPAPAPPVDPETRKRREKARAWAAVALNTPGVPRSH